MTTENISQLAKPPQRPLRLSKTLFPPVKLYQRFLNLSSEKRLTREKRAEGYFFDAFGYSWIVAKKTSDDSDDLDDAQAVQMKDAFGNLFGLNQNSFRNTSI